MGGAVSVEEFTSAIGTHAVGDNRLPSEAIEVLLFDRLKEAGNVRDLVAACGDNRDLDFCDVVHLFLVDRDCCLLCARLGGTDVLASCGLQRELFGMGSEHTFVQLEVGFRHRLGRELRAHAFIPVLSEATSLL